MIPGIDGQYEKFQSLCERLKICAAVLQPGLEHIHETISEMAKRLVQVVKIIINLLSLIVEKSNRE